MGRLRSPVISMMPTPKPMSRYCTKMKPMNWAMPLRVLVDFSQRSSASSTTRSPMSTTRCSRCAAMKYVMPSSAWGRMSTSMPTTWLHRNVGGISAMSTTSIMSTVMNSRRGHGSREKMSQGAMVATVPSSMRQGWPMLS